MVACDGSDLRIRARPRSQVFPARCPRPRPHCGPKRGCAAKRG